MIAVLGPHLLGCRRCIDDEEEIYEYFDIPFDPHDEELWKESCIFHRLHTLALNEASKTNKVRVRLDDNFYFQTRKDYECELK